MAPFLYNKFKPTNTPLQKVWFRDPHVIISLIALIISLIALTISTFQLYKEFFEKINEARVSTKELSYFYPNVNVSFTIMNAGNRPFIIKNSSLRVNLDYKIQVPAQRTLISDTKIYPFDPKSFSEQVALPEWYPNLDTVYYASINSRFNRNVIFVLKVSVDFEVQWEDLIVEKRSVPLGSIYVFDPKASDAILEPNIGEYQIFK